MNRYINVSTNRDSDLIIAITTIGQTNYGTICSIQTELRIGNVDWVNKQMNRLQFNMIRQGFHITNAGYGFIIAHNYNKHTIVFAKVDAPVPFQIPLEKKNITLYQ